jgi:hypothetical protein
LSFTCTNFQIKIFIYICQKLQTRQRCQTLKLYLENVWNP